MGRNSCCSKEGLNRGAWTFAEDKILTDYIKTHGEGRWRNLPQKAGLKRCGKSCRLRWLNYLRPDIKRGNISPDEEELIIRLHKLLGNRWSLIAGRLPGRTDNEIKNYWNTYLGKRAQQNTTNSTGNNKQHHLRRFTKMFNDPSSSGGSASPLPSDKMATPTPPVVLTKAIKCSTTVLLKPQPLRMVHGRDSHADKAATVLEVMPSDLEGNYDISNCENHVLMGSDHGTSSCLNGTGTTTTTTAYNIDHDQQNYLLAPAFFRNDLNIADDDDELCLVDLLNSDYQFLDFLPDYNNDNNNHREDNYVSTSTTTSKEVQSSSSSSTDILFSEEMLLKDWSLLQPNVGSEFNSDFSSEILDGAEGDWLAD